MLTHRTNNSFIFSIMVAKLLLVEVYLIPFLHLSFFDVKCVLSGVDLRLFVAK